MSSRFVRTMLCTIAASTVLAGCVKEVEQPNNTDESLREVVFHAGWDAETKTVLQEDGKVFWSPGDEINVFITNDESGRGYKLSSTNEEPAAKTDFVGYVGDKTENQRFVAVYPYNSNNYINPVDNTLRFNIPQVQTAAEGTFGKDQFLCMAVSEDENLYFKSLCSGIKFSVATPGITKVKIENGVRALSGSGYIPLLEDVENIDGFDYSVIVNAPSDSGFEPGKYYYASIYPNNYYAGISISYYKSDKVATRHYPDPVEFKRGVFKRLYNKDEGLTYFKAYDSYAFLPAGQYLLPEGIDKTMITEAYFHTKSSVTTDIKIEESGPVYFEMIGSVAHFYTPAEGYYVFGANNMFKGWSSLRSVDVSNFDTHDCSSFEGMFVGCMSLEHLDITGFDTGKATDMAYMFAGCSSLKSLDLSNFNTERVERMDHMFGLDPSVDGFNTQGCISLETLDLSCFNTSNVVSMASMFDGCCSLKEVNLKGWNTSNVESMSSMFRACMSLETLDVSMLDTKNVKKMASMFMDCKKLRSIDVSNFNTAKTQDMLNMFDHCENLTELDLSHFSLESLNMFAVFPFCYSLKKIDLGTLTLPDDIYGAFTETSRGSRACAIRCTAETKEAILNNHTFLMEPCITPEYFTWVLPEEDLPDLEDVRDPNLYYSADFSMDGKYVILHEASSGKGVEIVLMGDGYTDKLIEDGTYERDMRDAMNAIFNVEPYKSLKDMICVRMVYVVSLNEKVSGLTALWKSKSRDLNGNKVSEYALSAVKNKVLSDIAPVVIAHDETTLEGTGSEGLTYHVYSYRDNMPAVDYGKSAYSVCIIPKFASIEFFQYVLLHEFGHCFAKLADEYVLYDSVVPDYEQRTQEKIYSLLGACKNIDFTSDPTSIKWSRFLNDERYNNTGIGIYEGGYTYSQGVWRPTRYSIMNNADRVMFYNAPSREAIYNRIHKLSFGYNWEYDYEAFVQWDAPNIAADKEYLNTLPAQLITTATKSTKRPHLEMRDTVLPDGRKGKMIIMD